MAENNTMCDQIYKLRQDKFLKGQSTQEPTDANESAQVVELLRRNHDTMLEKYEVYRQRNEMLEKSQLEKEQLYVRIKSENEHLADQVYGHKRVAEDLKQENTILKQKLYSAEQAAKTNGEQAIAFKISKEKFENSSKSLQEQLEMITRSHDELVTKKQKETDLMQRELNQLAVRERDAKNKLVHVDREFSECRDSLRHLS